MSESIRTFIAINLDESIRRLINEIQNDLKKTECNVKWVKADNAHLTLKFLGNVKPKQIDEIKEILTSISQNTEAVNTHITQLGAFPKMNRPRVIWLGLHDEENEIASLASAIENELGKIGFKKENRPFKSHITLGRVRTPKNLTELANEIEDYELTEHPSQNINQIVLYKSTLTTSGPIYEALETFDLK